MSFQKTFFILGALLSTVAVAANIEISPGESIYIQANEASTISCSGEGGGGIPQVDCASKVQMLKARLDQCAPNNNDDWCVENIWPSWKQNNPTCVDDGILTCMNFCIPNNNDSWCVQTCQ